MACRLNYFSANEPLFLRYVRRIGLLPAPEILYRGLNIVLKKLQGGVLAFPQSVHIEVTNNCNLTCPMCPYFAQLRPKGFMEFSLFEKIIRQCQKERSLEKIALMGFGEPFLHPRLIEMAHYAKAHRIRHIFTSTNATLLSEVKAREIILQPSFDLLAISLDGSSKETYEKIRRGADFGSVTTNILTFLKIRESLKRKMPRLVLQFLIMKENHREKEAFLRFWKDKLDSQDTIFLRDVDTFGGQVPDYRLPSQLPRVKRKACLQLSRDMVISWQADVTVCCKDVNYLLKAGNINDASLKEIWLNEHWQDLRRLHSNKEWNRIALCANCSEWNQ